MKVKQEPQDKCLGTIREHSDLTYCVTECDRVRVCVKIVVAKAIISKEWYSQ